MALFCGGGGGWVCGGPGFIGFLLIWKPIFRERAAMAPGVFRPW